jgi:hypothetical protein
MNINLSLFTHNNITKKNIYLIKELYLKNIITIDKYNEWIKIIKKFPKHYLIIMNNLNNFKKNLNINLNNLNILNNNEPNFIILVSGQSNAGGWGSSYDVNNINDQTNENIFGYDITNSIWKKANLNDTSLGPAEERMPGKNLFAFHFAKHLIKEFPGIKPGIINVCSGGKPIALWALFDKNEKYYEINQQNAKITNLEQGYFFNMHKMVYKKAISQILNYSNKINVILWHQGESDNILHSNIDYYKTSLMKVINQYSCLNNNILTPFIAGTILDYYESNTNSDNINNIIRNINNNEYIYVELSKLNRYDSWHFTTESHRLIGKLYYDAYIKLLENISEK